MTAATGADSLVCPFSPSIKHNNLVSAFSLSQAEIVVPTLEWLDILWAHSTHTAVGPSNFSPSIQMLVSRLNVGVPRDLIS